MLTHVDVHVVEYDDDDDDFDDLPLLPRYCKFKGQKQAKVQTPWFSFQLVSLS